MDRIDALNIIKLAGDDVVLHVANIGCGPHSPDEITFTTGLTLYIEPIDKKPFEGVTVGDMEALAYEDNEFDGVMCLNALDHTKDAEKALREMIRVAFDWVYIKCNLIQKTTSGRGHYWDMLEDGTMTDGENSFNLKDYGFTLHNITYGGERRYDEVIATLKK